MAVQEELLHAGHHHPNYPKSRKGYIRCWLCVEEPWQVEASLGLNEVEGWPLWAQHLSDEVHRQAVYVAAQTPEWRWMMAERITLFLG
jgi:hypothetical protein